ncbi:undecaprenyl-diphosphate phosphatase [Euzebya sp.]|uniref:undecaprenyl-diphosphate phosphatase n=1 Tax=Euzebya sp. TaxID=1971409 RepID=UPI00351300E9
MFPAWLEALILGIVQGLTEFIPVSSSGHLVLVPYLMGWEKQSLAFDVMLHVGTLGAVLLYFRGELIAIIRGLLRLDRSLQGRIYRRVGLFIVPASIPIAIVGLFLEEQVAEVFESPLAAALLLLVTASLLFGLEAVRRRRVRSATPAAVGAGAGAEGGERERAWTGDWRAADTSAPSRTGEGAVDLPLGIDPHDPAGTSLADLTLRQAMVAGVMQSLAVLPGVSRSGSTIAGGVFAGLTREAATRFSFLLVIPALVGATILSLGDLGEPGGSSGLELGIGMAAAFVSGYLAIRFLVGLVSRARLTGFAWYCVAASVVGLIGYVMIGAPSSV